MDIRPRKPRVINLKKKKTKASVPVKIHIDSPIISEPVKNPWRGGESSCIQCGVKEAIELGRCQPCDSEHQKIVDRLDANPKQVIGKIPPKLSYRKEVSGGVVVTISTMEPLRINK